MVVQSTTAVVVVEADKSINLVVVVRPVSQLVVAISHLVVAVHQDSLVADHVAIVEEGEDVGRTLDPSRASLVADLVTSLLGAQMLAPNL